MVVPQWFRNSIATLRPKLFAVRGLRAKRAARLPRATPVAEWRVLPPHDYYVCDTNLERMARAAFST